MVEIVTELHTVNTEDNFPLASTVFSLAEETHDVIVIASGLGVPRYTYYKFSRFLASRGYRVITFDYRGIYESEDPGFPPTDMEMEEWGKKDIEAVLTYSLNELEADKLIFIGHSAGGQLVGLAPSIERVNAMVFISATLGHWRYWPGILKWGVFAFWHLIPLLTWNKKYFPAKLLGFSSIDIPSAVTRQWARWGRSPGYLFDFIDSEQRKRYTQLEMPLLAMSFDDDPKLGPRKAVDKILEFYPGVKLTRKHIQPGDYSKSGIGHFGFFKNEFIPSLWEETAAWLEEHK